MAKHALELRRRRGRWLRGRRFPARRPGFSLLELLVALTLFGIALSGMLPLVAIYYRGVQKLEKRVAPRTPCYLVPSSDVWARKLGACARVTTQDPGPSVPAPTLLVDDGEVGFQPGAGWSTQADSQSFRGDYALHVASPSTDMATWLFTDLPVSWYEIQATWLEGPNRTKAARYTIYDGDSLLGSYDVDQTTAPAEVLFESRPWNALATLPISSGSLQIDLQSSAVGAAVADGVRLVPVQNDVQILSLDRSLSSEAVTARVSITVKVPP